MCKLFDDGSHLSGHLTRPGRLYDKLGFTLVNADDVRKVTAPKVESLLFGGGNGIETNRRKKIPKAGVPYRPDVPRKKIEYESYEGTKSKELEASNTVGTTSDTPEQGRFDIIENYETRSRSASGCGIDEYVSNWQSQHAVTSSVEHADYDVIDLNQENSKWNRITAWFDDKTVDCTSDGAPCYVPNPLGYKTVGSPPVTVCIEDHWPYYSYPIDWEAEVSHADGYTESDFIIDHPRPTSTDDTNQVVDIITDIVSGVASHPVASSTLVALDWIADGWGSGVDLTKDNANYQTTFHWDIDVEGSDMSKYPGLENVANVRYNIDPVTRHGTAKLDTKSRFTFGVRTYYGNCPCDPMVGPIVTYTSNWNTQTYSMDIING